MCMGDDQRTVRAGEVHVCDDQMNCLAAFVEKTHRFEPVRGLQDFQILRLQHQCEQVAEFEFIFDEKDHAAGPFSSRRFPGKFFPEAGKAFSQFGEHIRRAACLTRGEKNTFLSADVILKEPADLRERSPSLRGRDHRQGVHNRYKNTVLLEQLVDHIPLFRQCSPDGRKKNLFFRRKVWRELSPEEVQNPPDLFTGVVGPSVREQGALSLAKPKRQG